MTQAPILNYSPHPGQEALHENPATVKVLQIGRRWGKSRFALWEGIRHFVDALDTPAASTLVPPFHMWVVVPSLPQGRQTWNEILSFIPKEFVQPGGVHQDDWMVYLKGSEKRPWGLLEVKSAYDPDSLQSVGLDYLWIQEAQDVSDRAFEKLLPTIRQSDRMSYAVFEGIPPLWSEHWFRRAYLSATRGRKGWYAYHATAFDNPLLSKSDLREIEQDREILTDAAWRRMYLAEFSSEAGFFRNIDACAWGDALPAPLPGVQYVAGIDLGRRTDSSVMLIADARQRRIVSASIWEAGEDWILQRESMAYIATEWGCTRVMVDATSTGGDMFCTELENMGIPVEQYVISGSIPRDHLLNSVAISLERGAVSFPPVPGLLRQLRAMQARKMPGGSWRVDHPPGEHDDYVFALALALEVCDAAHDISSSVRMRRASGRYLPTQAEAQIGSGVRSSGAQFMRDRMVERLRQRQEEIGVI